MILIGPNGWSSYHFVTHLSQPKISLLFSINVANTHTPFIRNLYERTFNFEAHFSYYSTVGDVVWSRYSENAIEQYIDIGHGHSVVN